MSALPSPRICNACSCYLAFDNTDPECSPCATKNAKQRWVFMSNHPSYVITSESLTKEGIYRLIETHNSTAAEMVSSLLKTGVLPSRLKRYQRLIVEMVEMPNESHSEVARKLHVTRWTIAAWRQRLGADAHENKNSSPSTKKVK